MSDRKKKLKALKKQEAKLEKVLAETIAKRDRLDDDHQQDQRQRDRIKDRKEEGREYDAEKLKDLNADLRKQNDELRRVRANIQSRRARLAKLGDRVSSLAKRIRNAARPKVIDLELNFRSMAVQTGMDKVIGHYTAGPQDRNRKDAIRLCRIYHQAHLARGWSGEGYALCFTVDGDILLLRPTRWVGAHTLGKNTNSVGIMMHGTIGDKPSKAQQRALKWWKKKGHKQVMRSGRTRKRPGLVKWYGHNDFNPTSCPGGFKKLYTSKGKNR